MCKVAGITAVFDSDGSVRPCCILPQVLGKVQQDSWDIIWTGERTKTIREEIQQGKNPICQHCRTYQNSSKQVYEGQDMYIQLQEVDLRISNRCNCKCIMCSPESSNQFSGELYEFPIEKILPILEQNVKTITRIHFAGGEPLLYSGYSKVLKLFQEREQMQYLTLSYNTNCTVFPGEEILRYWEQVHHISVDLSIDGVGEINDNIRVGSSWTRVSNVLERFLLLREENKERLYLNIHPAVSLRNFGHLWKLDEFANIKKVPVRWGNCIDTPEELSIWSLSKEDIEKKCRFELEHATTGEFRDFILRIMEVIQ